MDMVPFHSKLLQKPIRGKLPHGPDDFLIVQKEQNRIGDLVKEAVEKAYATEREATNLLEQAKRRVEELIEQDGAA